MTPDGKVDDDFKSEVSKSSSKSSNYNSSNWDMDKGGATIYTQHTLERRAPDTPAIKAELMTRANEVAISKGYLPGSDKYAELITNYVQLRNIPSVVIEEAINNGIKIIGKEKGTYEYISSDVTVITNTSGKVITVMPKRGGK